MYYDYDDFSLCDKCNVREYCREFDVINNNCIYDELMYFNEEIGDIIFVSNFEEKLKQKEIEFKKKRNYKKVSI